MTARYEPQPPRAGGTYLLVLRAPAPLAVQVGALGLCRLPAGWLLYVGSALSGLAGRLQRHARSDKPLHWHVDHLLAAAPLVEAWCHVSPLRLECTWVQRVAACPCITPSVRPIGASDCACHTHLFSAPTRIEIEAVFATLAADWPLLRCAVQAGPTAAG